MDTCDDLTECPNCGAVWGFEEIDSQECFCCGYPANEEDYDDD
jgi:Zn ribbon nucleic-acid-binding protein